MPPTDSSKRKWHVRHWRAVSKKFASGHRTKKKRDAWRRSVQRRLLGSEPKKKKRLAELLLRVLRKKSRPDDAEKK